MFKIVPKRGVKYVVFSRPRGAGLQFMTLQRHNQNHGQAGTRLTCTKWLECEKKSGNRSSIVSIIYIGAIRRSYQLSVEMCDAITYPPNKLNHSGDLLGSVKK
jgi:hypothetical protein